MTIPRRLHYCWFGGHEMPAMNARCVDSWREHLGDYEWVRWDESNVPSNPFVRHQLGRRNWAFASDYVRLHALHEQGGIYLDTDVEVIKPFDRLLTDPAFVALQAPGSATNAIAGSVPGHPFFADCITYLLGRFESGASYHISPKVTTKVLEAGSYDVVVHEPEWFYPYNPYDDTRAVAILMHQMITENTHAIHHWAKSWRTLPRPPLRKRIRRLLKRAARTRG